MSSAHGSMSRLQHWLAPALALDRRDVSILRSRWNETRGQSEPEFSRFASGPARNREHDWASGAGAELVSSLQLFCSRAPWSPGFRLLLETGSRDNLSIRAVTSGSSALHIGSYAGLRPLHEINLGACLGWQQDGPTPLDHITVQWNVCRAKRARRVRGERDLFHASHIESHTNDYSPLVAYLLRSAGVWARRVTQERVRSTKIEVAGYMQVIPRLFVCSAARQGTAVDIYSLARRVFCPHSFRCCFFWEESLRVLPLSSIKPQNQHAHDVPTQWR